MKTYTKRSLRPLGLLLLLAALPLTAAAQFTSSMQYFRPYDQSGVLIFETPKQDTIPFNGFKLGFGAAFTQQFQALDHSNEAEPVIVDGTNVNELIDIGNGFNLATANLNIDAQLADGIRVNVITYLSSRHHPEAWVKGGYILVDKLPMFNSQGLDNLMRYLTLRVGHFEINYGDAHFRRTDNANAIYNPFVGNYIMDSFTTEVGGEVYVRTPGGLLAMAGVTGGEIQGGITRPDERGPAFLGKLGFDRQFTPTLRARLTGSLYTTGSSLNNTLYGGDRSGSRYYLVMENVNASTGSNFTSGRFNPGLRDEITAFMINPFLKVGGLELFGIIEQATGRAANETEDRTWNQYSAEAVFRFLPREQLYVGARYNTISGELAGSGVDVSINRIQIGGGWFVTRNILAKVEYVSQQYNDFPVTDRFYEGEFNGIMIEGVVAF